MPHRVPVEGSRLAAVRAPRLAVAPIALAMLTSLGSRGDVLVEGTRFVDALFMSVITLSPGGGAGAMTQVITVRGPRSGPCREPQPPRYLCPTCLDGSSWRAAQPSRWRSDSSG